MLQQDSMGDHADDDQGEEVIFCAIVQCSEPRRVRINVMKRVLQQHGCGMHQEGDEIIEIFLKTGDAYEMCGEMQKWYSHCVPKVTAKSELESNGELLLETQRRISVILRKGQERYIQKDNGKLAEDLMPSKPVEYKFGSVAGETLAAWKLGDL